MTQKTGDGAGSSHPDGTGFRPGHGSPAPVGG